MNAGVAITSHGRRDELMRCLDSVARLDPAPSRIAVMVNGDSDESLGALLEHQRRATDATPTFEILFWTQNHGPWAGDNAAIDRLFFGDAAAARLDADDAYFAGFPGWREADAATPTPPAEPTLFVPPRAEAAAPVDFVLQLDDDAAIEAPAALAIAAAHFAAHPACGFIQARLLEPGRRDEGDIPFERAGFVSAGVAIRAAAWRDARPYPAWLFRSGGETVIAVRGLAAGWESHYLPALTVCHEPSARTRPAAHFHGLSLRNRYLLAALHQPAWLWPAYWVFHLGRSVLRRLAGRLETSPWRAFADAARLLPEALRRRRPAEIAAWQRFRALGRRPRPL